MSMKEENVFTFCVMSIVVQWIIAIMVTQANSGTLYMDTQTVVTETNNNIQMIQYDTALGSTGIVADDAGSLTQTSPSGTVFDAVIYYLNFPYWLSKITSLFAYVWTYIFMSPIIMSSGSVLGVFVGIIYLIWQWGTIIQLLRFIFPGRLV